MPNVFMSARSPVSPLTPQAEPGSSACFALRAAARQSRRRKRADTPAQESNTTCDGPDDASPAVLHERPGDNLEGIRDGEVGVALVDGEGLGLFAEKSGKHHFGGAAAGEEFGVEDMERLLQFCDAGGECDVQRCGRRPLRR